ncbi:MAG TPA: TonB-dependent receptor [Terriglobales bacterium]|nr:TonB-dependent receptor [Terriglobales bacterium]
MSKFSRSQLWWAALVMLVGQAFGQGGATGAISGTVQDVSGAVVTNAEVRIVNQDTGTVTRTAKTDATGSFTANLLPVATYTVTINSGGFREAKIPDVIVRITETTRMTAKLVPLQVLEKVEVQALVQTVETTTATTGQAIESKTIRDLPLATQNFQQLLTLSSGAQSELNASAQLGRGNVRVIVNGQREDNNNYLIEGISATDYNVAQATNIPLPNPDVIQEFKVQTSLYDASQGRNGGGNVNAILKSGTRTFHGDAYEFFRNDVLNANEYFLNRAGQSRPPVKQNIFGGSFGGPIGKEAQAGFFFVNYQGTRQRSGLSPGTLISTTIPVIPASIRDDATLDASLEAGLGIPSVDPVIHKLLLLQSDQFGAAAGGYLYPALPGNLGDSAPFVVSKPGKFTEDQFTATWDREFHGGNDKLGARFFFSNGEQLLPFGAGGLQASLGGTLASSISATDLDFPYDLPVDARFFTINETHLFSPSVVNDFRFGYVRINNNLINQTPAGVTADALGIDRPTNNITQSIYKFTFGSSGFQLGPTPPADQFQVQNNYSFVDTVSWVKGAHSVRFGGEYTRVNIDKKFPQVFNGQLFFVNGCLNTEANDPNCQSYSDFDKWVIGAPDFSFGGGGVYNHQYRNNNFGFFVQDDWKVSPQLTLNLGFRTEIMGAFRDNLCHIGNFDLGLANSGQYPLIYGSCANKLGVSGMSGSGSSSTFKNDYSTGLGPRVGFAWDVFGHHNTTVRGGYGIYYVREDVGTADQLSFQAPILPIAFGAGPPGCLGTFFSLNSVSPCPSPNPNGLPTAGVLDGSFLPCLGVITGFSSGTDNFPDISCANGSPGVVPTQFLFALVVPRHFVVPNTQQWNLTLQRELGKEWVLELGYVGTHAVHLRETRTNVQAQLATPTAPLNVTLADGSQVPIFDSTIANGPTRSSLAGVNGYSGMQIFANDAYSHYHSFQATLSRRWGRGYFQGAYTFSRSTDATSSGNTALNTAFNDESDLKFSRGLSDFDRPHRLTVSYNYDLPVFANATGLKRTLLANWSISGVTIFQSGTPFSVTDSGAGTAYLGPGLASATLGAQLAPGGSIGAGTTSGDIHNRIDGYLNLNNFVPAPPAYPGAGVTAFGDLGRNIYRGPFQQNWDFSLIKHFRITERQDMRFTADFFNIWNHANFSSPSLNDVENPAAFGKITSTVGTPRLIQFSLRYAF